MNAQHFCEWLWAAFEFPLIRTDWQEVGWTQKLYVGFNAAEAILWWSLAIFVWIRWGRNRQTPLEHLYAISFVVFGLTDVLEMDRYTVGLLMLKGFVLASILLCRHLVLKQYPGRKL